ncbi:MAG: hypothetical protein ACI8YQ_002426 [Polaribacter sp.]|jgi:hypothetical protein
MSCKNDDDQTTDLLNLADHIQEYETHLSDEVIACSAGRPDGLDGQPEFPTSTFFLPKSGATDFKYFETENLGDSLDFSKYIEKDLSFSPVFNGYLQKFNNNTFTGERMAVVTYQRDGALHSSTPIRLKVNPKPTELNPSLLTITPDGINPGFSWEDGTIAENVIYFQVISDADGNLISGTYTIEKQFTFYNLDNVVLNIADQNPAPVLEANTSYQFTMMAVSEDNWVNLLLEQAFMTE